MMAPLEIGVSTIDYPLLNSDFFYKLKLDFRYIYIHVKSLFDEFFSHFLSFSFISFTLSSCPSPKK